MLTLLSITEEVRGFQWMEECEEAFQDLKKYLVSPLILSCLNLGEDLYIYLAISEHAMSAVLLKNQEGVQRPIYYISKTLVDAETRYLPLEKLALASVHDTRKLPYIFKHINVLMEYPLQSLLRRSDFMGRIAKWGTKLGLFDIRYRLRNSVKGQVLIDFVAEFTPIKQEPNGVYSVSVLPWKVYVNGAFNAWGAGIGIVVMSPEGVKLEHSLRLGFRASK